MEKRKEITLRQVCQYFCMFSSNSHKTDYLRGLLLKDLIEAPSSLPCLPHVTNLPASVTRGDSRSWFNLNDMM